MAQHTFYVDSRLRSSGTDSDFEITLRESVHLDGHRLRVDHCRFVDSFFTTDLGKYVYYKDGSGGLQYFALPEQAYTGPRLAVALQTATGRTTTYSDQTNAITQAVVSGQEWLSDEELRAFSSGFAPGASAAAPLSLNAVLGPGTVVDGSLVWSFVKMSPYDHVFLRSRRLTVENSHAPNGAHDVLCMIPLEQGVGRTVVGKSPDGVAQELPADLVLKTVDFKLTDYKGAAVNLRGRSLSFQLTLE